MLYQQLHCRMSVSKAKYGSAIMSGSSCNTGSWLRGLLPDQTDRDSLSVASFRNSVAESPRG